MRGTVWIILLAVLLLLAVIGEVRSWLYRSQTAQERLRNTHVTVQLEPGVASGTRLFILVHVFTPNRQWIDNTATVLKEYGDVLRVAYPAATFSNATADDICTQLAAKIATQPEITRYSEIVFVAHSAGALLARRALLLGMDARESWAGKVHRVVLLAGTNRGWSLSGEKPPDLGTGTRLLWRFGEWVARLTGVGSFILDFQAGAPFVANLRLDWMRRMRDLGNENAIEVVQLLGDIDNIVSRDDSEDLRIMASKKYAFLLVRGTGHGDIIDLDDSQLGAYRRNKLILAATARFETVLEENEEQPFTTQSEITSVVFVLHGIRDLGKWSSEFETEIRSKAAEPKHVAIVSPRYGYLGMGPFLLPSVREHYVRWFMDQYTETLARYPGVHSSDIYFFGHSNGAYLLTKALEQYSAMRINRVVLAGSVVPRDYDWQSIMEKKIPQVEQVRNYVGTEDWVVALFPRLFELRPFLWLENELGSSGFNGFDAGGGCEPDRVTRVKAVTNVCYVKGEHSAFEGRVTEIVDFLLAREPSKAVQVDRPTLGWALDSRVTVWFTWLLITSVIVWIGFRVVLAAPSPSWVVLVLYALLVLRTLQTI
jgi:alpha-beta hydrolase superfamily lysophospholipase